MHAQSRDLDLISHVLSAPFRVLKGSESTREGESAASGMPFLGPGRNHTAQLAIVKQMSRQESRSSAGPDHVTLQALITWLIMH